MSTFPDYSRGFKPLSFEHASRIAKEQAAAQSTFEARLARENPDIPADEIAAHVEDIYAENPDLF